MMNIVRCKAVGPLMCRRPERPVAIRAVSRATVAEPSQAPHGHKLNRAQDTTSTQEAARARKRKRAARRRAAAKKRSRYPKQVRPPLQCLLPNAQENLAITYCSYFLLCVEESVGFDQLTHILEMYISRRGAHVCIGYSFSPAPYWGTPCTL